MTWRFDIRLESTLDSTVRVDEIDLIPIARVAVATPLVEAESALNFLADMLLLRGKIREYPEEVAVEGSGFCGNYSRPPTPLEQARQWALTKTAPSVLDRLRALAAKFRGERQASPARFAAAALAAAVGPVSTAAATMTERAMECAVDRLVVDWMFHGMRGYEAVDPGTSGLEALTAALAEGSAEAVALVAKPRQNRAERRARRGLNGTPLALRAKLKPWER